MLDSQTTVEEASLATVDADAKLAESSAAEPGGKGSEIKSTLDLVRDLHGPDKSPSSENGQETKSVTAETVLDPEAKAKAEEDEWVKSLSKQSQNRFRALNDSNKTLSQENAGLKEVVQKFEGYEQIIQANGLSNEDVKSGFEIMGMLRSSPEDALRRLTPIIRGLLDYVGYTLPDDLKAEVEAGALTQDRARELAAARNRVQRGEQNAEAREEQQRTAQQQKHVGDMTNLANEWSAKQKTSDPDWHLKSDRVSELVKLHLYEKGIPVNAAEATKLFDETKKKVDAELKKFVPRPQAKTVPTGDSSPSAKPEPKTFLDVVKQAVGGNS
jgi:hypothetical protein